MKIDSCRFYKADARRNRKTRMRLAITAVVLIALILWIAWGNTAVELNTYIIQSDRLPRAFDGYRIAQVSDLHNTELGDGHTDLLALLQKAAPDCIVITGDLIDSRNTDIHVSLAFAESAVEIAPCYYVTGNHEARLPASDYQALEQGLLDLGVTVLHDSAAVLEKDGAHIALVGLVDPAFTVTDADMPIAGVGKTMDPAKIGGLASADTYTVLLSHRPEFFESYAAAGVDLVFCGHAHGGQIRIPLVGGLVAPGQGLLPAYDAGLYTKECTNMLVSRGLGNSLFPFRVNNRPQVIVAELQASDAK